VVYSDWIPLVSTAVRTVREIRGATLGRSQSTERAQNEDGMLNLVSIVCLVEYLILRSKKRRNSGGSESSVLRPPPRCESCPVIDPSSYS